MDLKDLKIIQKTTPLFAGAYLPRNAYLSKSWGEGFLTFKI